MKNLKIYEEYNIDTDGDIGEEYVKAIMTHYIDHMSEGGALQNSFDFYCKEDLEEELRYIVVNQLRSYINKLQDQINTLLFTDDDYLKSDANKYDI